MLQRAKPHVHARFHKFPDFLYEVGPKPVPKATLDRIVPSDPEYAPGKVRWADAHTQSNNRSISRLFDDPDGNQYTVAELAKRQGCTPNAIHQRLRSGWSYAEIVAGKRSSPGQFRLRPNLERSTTRPHHLRHHSRSQADLVAGDGRQPTRASGTICPPARRRGFATLRNVVQAGGLRFYEEDVVRYAINNWSRFTARAKSAEGAYGIPDNPTVDFLQKYIRVAVNLYLEENGLEFTGTGVRLKEQSTTPALEHPGIQPIAPVAPKYVEMPY